MLNVACSVSPPAHRTLATNSRPLRNRAFALAAEDFVEISENCLRTEISFGAVAVGKDFAATVHQNETRKATHAIVLNGGLAPEGSAARTLRCSLSASFSFVAAISEEDKLYVPLRSASIRDWFAPDWTSCFSTVESKESAKCRAESSRMTASLE